MGCRKTGAEAVKACVGMVVTFHGLGIDVGGRCMRKSGFLNWAIAHRPWLIGHEGGVVVVCEERRVAFLVRRVFDLNDMFVVRMLKI